MVNCIDVKTFFYSWRAFYICKVFFYIFTTIFMCKMLENACTFVKHKKMK